MSRETQHEYVKLKKLGSGRDKAEAQRSTMRRGTIERTNEQLNRKKSKITNLHVWHPVLTLGLLALVFLILTSAALSGLEASPTCSGIRLLDMDILGDE